MSLDKGHNRRCFTTTLCQFHKHFTSSFLPIFFCQIITKAKLVVGKSCEKHFCTKRLLKNVGKIDTWTEMSYSRSGVKTDKLIGPDHVSKMSSTESNLSIDDCVARHTWVKFHRIIFKVFYTKKLHCFDKTQCILSVWKRCSFLEKLVQIRPVVNFTNILRAAHKITFTKK